MNSVRSTGTMKNSAPTPWTARWDRLARIWFASLYLAASIQNVQSHDPLYRLVSHRTVHSSSQPWRRQSPKQYSARRQRPVLKSDYSDKFLDFDAVAKDPRARIFNVDFKRRRPNQLSITSRLVVFTVAAFCLQMWKPAITRFGMKLSDRIIRGEELYRTVTPIFLHGGIFHLFTNMMSLQRVGNDVEKLFGPGRYLSTYMIAGIAGNIVSALQSPNPSLGASGAVFGVVGAYFVFLNRNEWILGRAGEAMTTSIGQTMATNLLLGYFMPQIDQWAHLGGAIGGGFMAYAFGPRLYMTEISAGGGVTRRVIVDRPICRAPSYLESIPGNIAQQWMTLTGAIDSRATALLFPTGKPWQTYTGHNQRNRPRRFLPTRSIKPGKVD